MNLKKGSIGFSVAFGWLLLLSQLSCAQTLYSFTSWDFPAHYIRHQGLKGFIHEISDDLGKKDATFRYVPGLAGKCSSLESVNYPNHFLRHGNFRIHLSEKEDSKGFREDATFCLVPGLANFQGKSFESVNFPGYYIRHQNYELWLGEFEDSKLFKDGATFVITEPLWRQ